MSAVNRSLRGARLGVVALVLCALVGAWHLGVFALVAEPRVLAATLVEMGAWGYLAFILAYTALQPFGVPGTIFIVAAPLIWPWRTAFALSMIGTMGASVVGFSFARFVARDYVAARVPARLRKYEASLERSAFPTVVFLRLILWMPQALHFFLGVSKVRFWTHFWGSLVGYAPPLLLVSYLGGEMFDASGQIQPGAWPILAGLLLASLLITALVRVHARRRSLADPATRSTAPGRSAPPQ
ncbi:TVP38/TMEM64 family protein [Nannocystis pusilla]|uniref:TVP38/TMEM64 family protein n=1 Tax=Nannocystis pusilla TaxID=889268 RepID=UPI003DA27D1B